MLVWLEGVRYIRSIVAVWIFLGILDGLFEYFVPKYTTTTAITVVRLVSLVSFSHLFSAGIVFYLIWKEERQVRGVVVESELQTEAVTAVRLTFKFLSRQRWNLSLLLLCFIRECFWSWVKTIEIPGESFPYTVPHLYLPNFAAAFVIFLLFSFFLYWHCVPNVHQGILFTSPESIFWRCLLFLGTISYPLYLLHQKIGFFILLNLVGSSGTGLLRYTYRGLNLPVAVAIPLAIVAVIVLASLVTHYLEKPIMSYLRFVYRRHRQSRQHEQQQQQREESEPSGIPMMMPDRLERVPLPDDDKQRSLA